jgi:hypothetical protein
MDFKKAEADKQAADAEAAHAADMAYAAQLAQDPVGQALYESKAADAKDRAAQLEQDMAKAANDAADAKAAKDAADAQAAADAKAAQDAADAKAAQDEADAKAAKDAADAKAVADAKAASDAKAAEDAARAASASTNTGGFQFGNLSAALSALPTSGSAPTSLSPSQLVNKGSSKPFESVLADFQKLAEQPLTGENSRNQQTQESPLMSSPYYNYGEVNSIDSILNPQDQNGQDQQLAAGGMATPLMAAGGITGTRYGQYAHGGMATPLMAAGGKMRVDFRHGDAVTGAGDGQSDDIPAMLADGEFVFPADVVAAIGNGSTKAGSDKLYDMMHGIRAHVRSAHPKDLPPEIKSPLDFLKTKPSKAGRK